MTATENDRHRWQNLITDAMVGAIGTLGLTLAFFYRAAFTTKVFFHDDLGNQLVLFQYFAQQQWHRGELPLWCREMFCGYPLFAEGQMAALYPFSLLFYGSLPAWHVLKWSILLHFWISGFFTYLCARTMGRSRAASFAASAVYVFSLFMVSHLTHVSLTRAATWFPLLFLLTWKALTKHSLAWVLGAGSVLGLQMLAGHPQTVLISVTALAWLAIWGIDTDSRRGPGNSAVTRILVLTVILAIGMGVSCCQWLPTAELGRNSWRALQKTPEYLRTFSLPLQCLTLFLTPNRFGNPATGDWNGPSYFWEVSGFVGITALSLALTGIIFQRNRTARFFAFLFVFSLLMALAAINPIYSFLPRVPVFNLFRAPARYLMLTTFAIAHLTALQVDSLCRDRGRSRQWWVFAMSTLLLCVVAMLISITSSAGARIDGWAACLVAVVNLFLFAAAARRPREKTELAWVTTGLIVFELFRAGIGYNPVTDATFYTETPPIAAFLRKDTDRFRIFHIVKAGYRNWSHWSREQVARHDRDCVEYCFCLLDKLDNVYGYSPLTPRRFADFHHALFTEVKDRSGRTTGMLSPAKLAGMANCKYVIADIPLPPWDFTPVCREGAFTVFQNRLWLPRYRFARTTIPVKPGSAPGIWHTSEFDPSIAAIVEKFPAYSRGSTSLRGHILVRGDSPNHLQLTVTCSRDACLVIADSWDVGWRGFVDGALRSLAIANHFQRALLVPAGQHDVSLIYYPTSFQFGLFVSLCALAGLMAAIVHLALRTHTRRPIS